MSSSIIYKVTLYVKPFLVVSIVVLIIAAILYMMAKKFQINKHSTKYLGLLTGFKKIQIVQLSLNLIKTILIIYFVVCYQSDIFPILIMISILSLWYIITMPNKMIFETINTVAQVMLVYIINTLHSYRINICSENYIFQVEISLIVFIIFYTLGSFLKNVEDIIIKENKQKKRGKQKNEKREHI